MSVDRRDFLVLSAGAATWAAHLVAQGVPADRLLTKGYGAEHLRIPQDPGAGENRRVELQRLQ